MKQCIAFLLVGTVFTAGQAGAEPGSERTTPKQLGLTVWDKTGLQLTRPVTGGIPLARGTAPAGVGFALHDQDLAPVPCQSTVLARWQDGSARWVLLDFAAQPPPHGKVPFTLSYGPQVKPAPVKDPLEVISAEPWSGIQAGALRLLPDKDSLWRFSDRLSLKWTLVRPPAQHGEAQVG